MSNHSSAPTEPLADLSSSYPLTQEQIASYRRDGHVLTPGLLSADEIASYRPGLVAAVDRLDREQQGMEKLVQGKNQGWKFVQNLWERDPVARQFVLAKRFAKGAADLMGVDAVRLFRDQSYFKEPGAGNTSWHQDGYFMPLDTEQIITLWLPLHEITPDMAPMHYFNGSHRSGYLGVSGPSLESIQKFQETTLQKGYTLHNYGHFAVGDAAFHSGWTLHGSLTNHSSRTREALVIVYYADGAHVRVDVPFMALIPMPEELYATRVRRENLAQRLPGLKAGDLAASPANPLVYSKEATG